MLDRKELEERLNGVPDDIIDNQHMYLLTREEVQEIISLLGGKTDEN